MITSSFFIFPGNFTHSVLVQTSLKNTNWATKAKEFSTYSSPPKLKKKNIYGRRRSAYLVSMEEGREVNAIAIVVSGSYQNYQNGLR
jgi:hypothetical protein